MATRGRIPLQSRKANVISTSSSSDEYISNNSQSAKRYWPPLEDSSHNENNKRISSFATSLRSNSETNDNSNSSTVAQTGAPGFAGRPQVRSSSAVLPFKSSRNTVKPKFSRSSSDPNVLAKGSTNPTDEEILTIEEKRRKLNGDGYTLHRYHRGRLLGKGGFAKVYYCTALDTNKAYAVKIVPKANLVKPRAKQKLQAEIKIHRTLKHRYICEYKHFFEDKTNCYILLELCHNQSMNELIKRRKRLTEPEAAYYMKQLIDAVRYMHGQRVIHRDLKLGNLFLDKSLQIKVGDLGLATRLERDDEKRKTICGTPNYIAPEVIQGTKETRGHSFEVDIWSMGVILYTILIGKPPYEAKDVKATYQRIIANQYSFPSNIVISDQARSLISSMLQSKPRMRPKLDEIDEHAFFTSNSFIVPVSLPSNAIHVAPQWREDEFGYLVAINGAEDENEIRVQKKKSQFSLPLGLGRRQPFASKDPNVATTTRQQDSTHRTKATEKEVGEVPAMNLRTALIASSLTKPQSKPAFKIYDETESALGSEPAKSTFMKSLQCRSSKESDDGVEDLTSKTAALTMQSRSTDVNQESRSHSGHRVKTPRSQSESDAKVLYSMLENIIEVLESEAVQLSPALQSPPCKPLSRGGPTKWVTRYVDYTSKYGLGFLLNDGSSGVYFNDSTKAVLAAEGEYFQYIERKKIPSESPDDTTIRRSEPLCEMHTLSSYPEVLEKKVTLLKHFRNYLVEQQKNSDEDVGNHIEFAGSNGGEPVYLKKWVRTKHAILFRLSNQTIQIIFYDQTELLLTPDERFITYVDKQGRRSTYHFNDDLVASNAELAKRLKYSKEILSQLVAGQRR